MNDSIRKQLQEMMDTLSFLSNDSESFLYLCDWEEKKLYFTKKIDEKYRLPPMTDGAYSVQDVMTFLRRKHGIDLQQAVDDLLSGRTMQCSREFQITDLDGRRVMLKTAFKLQGEDKRWIVGYITDVGSGKHMDTLSGLPDAVRFTGDLAEAVLRGGPGFLMLLDIDNFKDFNTKYGRGYGNQIIQSVAEILEECVGDSCTLYRLDGDKFAVLPGDGDVEAPEDLFAELRKHCAHICSFSCGVAEYPGGEALDGDALYQQAENALDQAKRQGKNSLCFFSSADYERQLDTLQLQDELKRSVEQGFAGFSLNFQPQIECVDYELFGVETLLRYQSPQRGPVGPDEFIPILEASGLIVDVGLWVLETALKQCRLWREHLPDLHISVNVSYIQLRQKDITERILALLEQIGIPGDALTLEVTESVQLQDHQYFNRLFYKLQRHGIKIAIDDFGTGYSSLSYLKLLSVDEVKIDRCFVSRIQHSTYNYRLISNMIELAHSTQIRVCCEGLETEQEFMVLKDLHPDLIQGYLFAKPYDQARFERRFINTADAEYSQREQRRDYYRGLASRDSNWRLEQAEHERLSTIVDSMEELVYVRDLDTYELLYMNAAGRELTGMYDYKGRKCYQVLVGRDTPCETCTGSCLNTETYHVREKRNAYLQRHFMLKEKLIYWQNKPAGLTVTIDLTEKEIMSQNVQEKLEFERNIVDCTKMLLEETDIRKAINGVLRSIGTFYKADRAYLFELQKNRQFWDNTYEWCADGIAAQIDMLQDVPVSATRRWQELFRKGESILIEDVEAIRALSPEEYEILAAQEITHLIVSPVWSGQNVIGFIGVDNPRKHAGNCGQVQTMALFLADRILKDKTKDRLQELLNLHYSDILKTTELGLWVIRLSKDGTRKEMYADQTMRNILGIKGEVTAEECYRHWYGHINEGYYHYVNYSVTNMIETGHTVELCYTWNHPEKGEVTVRCLGTRVEDMNDMICLEGYHREINEVDRSNFLPDDKSIIFEYNENRQSVYFHNSRAPLAGTADKEDHFPRCWLRQRMVHPHFAKRFEAVFTNIHAQPELEGEEFLLKTADGSYEWFKMKTRHLGDSQQDTGTMVVILDPAKQERAMELEFMRQKDFYQAILSEKIAYAEIDMESHRILSAGGLWCSYVDNDRNYEELLRQYGDRMVHPEDARAYRRFISADMLHEVMSRQKDTEKLQLRQFIDGKVQWAELTGHVFQDQLTENVYALLYMQDIDARKRRELEQEIAATRDPLTKVYNRRAFEQELTEYVMVSEDDTAGTLILIDLDNFKEINDTYGHAEGDRVLKQMADVLLSVFRRKDLVGRFGGDEFLIFLKNTTDKKVIDRRMQEISKALAAMNEYHCSCSAGITVVNRTDFHYETALKRADVALYRSKNQGKKTRSYFDEV